MLHYLFFRSKSQFFLKKYQFENTGDIISLYYEKNAIKFSISKTQLTLKNHLTQQKIH